MLSHSGVNWWFSFCSGTSVGVVGHARDLLVSRDVVSIEFSSHIHHRSYP